MDKEPGSADADALIARLTKRLNRERKAKEEAEAIAERVTADLYASAVELERLNGDLEKTNEELQELNQSMRDFVAVASHDLRGPLTSILGWTATMRTKWDRLPQEQLKEFLGIIERDGHHLARMIEDLLTVSRIEAGALDIHKDVIALRNAFETAIEDFADRASEVDYQGSDGLSVVADPDHLQRILVNYVGNALKYGQPPVTVEALQADGFIEIRVKDRGVGVPIDFIPRLFGKFARGDDPNTLSQKGTGLGLSIVKGLAEANGGQTWYEPNRPSGSCFAVRLPKAS
ncbi:MAG: sensor histidine kinase [Actinomycetota bacterium]|nr:HAMP domain-containing histidine kinase [Actinomycetota bacterium]